MISAARQVFEAALKARVFCVEPMRGGARRVTYTGERTARNTERDVLSEMETLARKVGLVAGVAVSRARVELWINPEPPARDEPTNDIGHAFDCGCPACMPEDYDPAELEAGRGEKTCGAEAQRKEDSA